MWEGKDNEYLLNVFNTVSRNVGVKGQINVHTRVALDYWWSK